MKYIEVVQSCTNWSFAKAADEVKELSNHSTAGEVSNQHELILIGIIIVIHTNSGLLLMLAMIQLLMHTTLQFLVCLEGMLLQVLEYNYTLAALFCFYSTQKILACVTLSRKEHACAQTRELACTKLVLPDVIARGKDVQYSKYS